MEMFLQIVSWAMIGTGALAVLVGGVGVLRFPDVYSRLHAASVTDTMGAAMILGGLIVHEGLTLLAAKLALTLAFLLLTSPTASFTLAHAALTSGVKPLLHGEDRKQPDAGNDSGGGRS
jgi:multicomponent Na+:H+ antiporter subunit G